MVAVVKLLADIVQTQVRHAADEVHGDLPGGHGVPHPLLAPDDGFLQVVVLADVLQNGLGGGNVFVAALEHVLDGTGDGLLVGVVAQKVLKGHDLIDGALQLADVGGDVLRDEHSHLVRQLQSQQGGLVFHDGQAGLKVRRRHVHQKAPLKPGAEAVLQHGHLRGGSVGGQHDLAAGLVEVVEGMEKLLLGLLFAGDELHVIHQQKVRLAVFFTHFGGLVGAGLDGGHQLVGQIVALDVGDLGPGVVFLDDVGDGVDQVGLAKAGVPVNEEGVVILGGMLRHRHGGGVGQLVGGAHHKGLKGELVGGKAVTLLFGAAAELRVRQVVQNTDLEIHGEEIPDRILDVFHEKVFNVAPLEIVGAVENEGISADVHGLQLVEPGVDGRFRKLALQSVQDLIPHISDGIQKEAPLSS